MDAQEAFEKFNRLWKSKGQPGLNDIQKTVFLGLWNKQTFPQIAEKSSYQKQTIRGIACNFFYPKLQEVFLIPYKISKTNFKTEIQTLFGQNESSIDLNPEPELTISQKPDNFGNGEKSDRNNPFIPLTGIVDDPQLFFDREKPLKDIFELLNSGSSVAVVGERAIGKSSVLQAICQEAESKLLQPREGVYLNLQPLENEEEFYLALCDRLEIEPTRGYRLTRELKKHKKLLLVMDKVEKLTWDGFTEGQMVTQLRALAEGMDAPLRLIFGSNESLDKLYKEKGKISPFENICIQVNLCPWNETTARAFIAHRLAPTQVSFTEAEISQIIAETGGHPQQLMQRCYQTYAGYLQKN